MTIMFEMFKSQITRNWVVTFGAHNLSGHTSELAKELAPMTDCVESTSLPKLVHEVVS